MKTLDKMPFTLFDCIRIDSGVLFRFYLRFIQDTPHCLWGDICFERQQFTMKHYAFTTQV